MPRKDDTDAVWRYVRQSLAMARGYAWNNGYGWRGESCCAISTLALGAIIRTRRGERGELSIATDDPDDPKLACADHYLQTRMDLGQHGCGVAGIWRKREEVMIQTYDSLKRIALRGQPVPGRPVSAAPFAWISAWLDRKLREKPDRPLSMPTEEARQWAGQGIVDGIADFDANPDLDNQPAWLLALVRRLFMPQ